MNNKTRKEIEDLIKDLEQACQSLEGPVDSVSFLQEDEQEKYDNLSEGLQATEKGEAIEQAASDLDDANSLLQDAVSTLTEAIDKLREVTEG